LNYFFYRQISGIFGETRKEEMVDMVHTSKFLLLLLLLGICGCSSVQVSQDYTSADNLNGLRSYAWHYDRQEETGDIRIDSPLIDTRIRTAIDETLRARGYRKTSREQADFHVAYQYAIRAKVRSDNVHTSVGVGFGSYGRRGAFGVSSGSDVSSYDEGLLVIDILDSRDGSTLWRGKGTRQVSMHSKPEEMTERVNEAVHKILDQFPP
jgi:hypothetical protein